MADNYLERKMEDLRSGRLSAEIFKTNTHRPSSTKQSIAGNNKALNFNLASRRILIIGGATGIGHQVTTAFVEAGCRVAVFDTYSGLKNIKAHDGRIRFTQIDENIISSQRAWQSLITSWHDVDVIIATSRLTDIEILAQWWVNRRTTHPSVSRENSTVVVLYPTTTNTNKHIAQNETSSCTATNTVQEEETVSLYDKEKIEAILHRLYTLLYPHNIDVSALGYLNTEKGIAQNCLFLAVPGLGNRKIIMY